MLFLLYTNMDGKLNIEICFKLNLFENSSECKNKNNVFIKTHIFREQHFL